MVDPSAPYPQQTLLTPAGPGAPARQTGPAGPAFPVDSVPFADRPTHLSSPSGLAPGAGTAAPAAYDPWTGPVPELPGSIRPGPAVPSPKGGSRRSRRGLALAAIGAPGVGFKNAITFTMTAGGTMAQENEAGGCVNTLTLTSTTAGVLTFSEPGAGGCVAGTVTFTRQGATLAYRWTNSVEQETATLHES